MEKELETLSLTACTTASPEDSHPAKVAKHGHDYNSSLHDTDEVVIQGGSKSAAEKGSKKKKGKSSGNTKGGNAESALEIQELTATKSKKNQRKGKASASQVSDSNLGAKKDVSKMDIPSFLSEESLIHKVRSLITDFDDEGMLSISSRCIISEFSSILI